GAAAHAHETSELRAGDRLLRPHQVQRDLPVDLAGRSSTSDPERGWADATHAIDIVLREGRLDDELGHDETKLPYKAGPKLGGPGLGMPAPWRVLPLLGSDPCLLIAVRP